MDDQTPNKIRAGDIIVFDGSATMGWADLHGAIAKVLSVRVGQWATLDFFGDGNEISDDISGSREWHWSYLKRSTLLEVLKGRLDEC